MNASKITVPPSVATAIRFFTDLADTKHEAFADILSLGYESERSQLILCHFDGNYDELMEALICGYQIEKSPEEKVREYYSQLMWIYNDADYGTIEEISPESEMRGIVKTLDILGIKIEGVNA